MPVAPATITIRPAMRRLPPRSRCPSPRLQNRSRAAPVLCDGCASNLCAEVLVGSDLGEGAADAIHEPAAPLLAVAIHVMERQIDVAARGMAQRREAALDDAACRIAHHEPDLPPGAPIGRDGDELDDVVKLAVEAEALDLESDAGQPDAVEPALEDGGKAEPPVGKDEDERFGALQPRHMLLDAGEVAADI